MTKKAVELFTATPRQHNCAQSVASGCGREDLNSAMQSNGGGRAPGGLCGALYAALHCVREENKEHLLEDFVKEVGGTHCKELKEKGISCTKCVEVGAKLLKKYDF